MSLVIVGLSIRAICMEVEIFILMGLGFPLKALRVCDRFGLFYRRIFLVLKKMRHFMGQNGAFFACIKVMGNVYSAGAGIIQSDDIEKVLG